MKHASKAASGANVMYCGHNGYFIADLIQVGNAVAVNASAPVTPANLIRDSRFGPPTHHLLDFPVAGFWKPNRGVFVVPEDQVKVLS